MASARSRLLRRRSDAISLARSPLHVDPRVADLPNAAPSPAELALGMLHEGRDDPDSGGDLAKPTGKHGAEERLVELDPLQLELPDVLAGFDEVHAPLVVELTPDSGGAGDERLGARHPDGESNREPFHVG